MQSQIFRNTLILRRTYDRIVGCHQLDEYEKAVTRVDNVR